MAAFVFATGWRRLLGPAGGIALLGAIDPRALGVSVLLLAPWHVVLTAAGHYRSRRFGTRTREAFDVLRAVALATVLAALGMRVFLVPRLDEAAILLFFSAASGVLLVSRVSVRVLLARVRARGRNLRYLLVVGTNARATRFADFVREQPQLGYRVLGFVDDEWPGLADFRARGERILSGLGDVRTVLRTQVVDEVVISVPLASLYAQASSIVAACEEQGVIIRVLANLFNLRVGRVVTDDLAGIPVTTVHTGAMRGWPIAIKRFLDVAIAAILLTLSLPLLLFVAAAIKLSSPGPVLFVQERIGLNKRRFRLYKFRTMVPGAELEQAGLRHLNEATGPVFKMRADPRVTSVGRVLRRTSIEELPQLFNVLTGDMSMVGPRPLPVRDYEGFDEDRHRRRFSVRPGLTCLWQVSGRHLIPFEGWMALDLHYIDHWSLWLDIKTMLRTIPAVIRGSGAS